MKESTLHLVLRLRGGGGYEVEFLDKRTGKKKQTKMSDQNVTHIEMINAIVKQEGVPTSEIILIIDDKPLTKGHIFELDGGNKTEIIFIKKYNFKDVVFT